MKFLFSAILTLFTCALLSAQANISTAQTLYEYVTTGKDSGLVAVKTIVGQDTSVQYSNSLNVKNLAAEKAAQKAEVLRMLQRIDAEYDFLMDIFFNVRQLEEKNKKLKK